MTYTLITSNLPLREENVSYDDLAPGLYPGESVVEINTGAHIAISVASKWLDTGAGVVFQAWARALSQNGQTMVGPEGQHIETTFTHTVNSELVAKYGIPAISKEMLLAVLGEPPTKVPDSNKQDAAMVPMFGWSEEIKNSVAIATAMKTALDTAPEAQGNPADLLGLL